MIFVTVGTHEQQFDRLVKEIDYLKEVGMIIDEVFIQTGYCTYEPKFCEYSKLLTYKEMWEKICEAKIVITHGGPSSFIMPLQKGKNPIVVPRQLCFGEHVNDHQVEFVKFVEERHGNIVPVYDINNLGEVISNYENIISNMSAGMVSNNKNFNDRLEEIINKMLN